MARSSFAAAALLLSCARALVPARPSCTRVAPPRAAGLDPTSPEMQAEFEKLKGVDRSEVESELELLGIPTSPDMDDMTVKLRLMEARIIFATPDKAGPAANASPYEKLIAEKPSIKTYVDGLYNKGDTTGANVFMEYVNNPEQAKSRYGSEALYQKIFEKADELVAAPAFTSATLAYAGFPMMGEDALRGQMESIGEVASFSVTEEDPVLGMTGVVTFAEESSAVTAVEKWDGADMGNEVMLTLKYK
mmetsp:Transcript_27489/g.82509  ORF Transcript_27489/g.82509 Transcript_27489/m.82509 type:complete len:248 (+) Transcript_27489:415-1158(+)|eukprot:CAMPEP_0119266902 /NCGR_PEP_ID=MMETSP1329-20130426/5236_1 /TAXON_ID=114041 /ORGANISM="Genus nov. species nov., Strain RCC1024" /LENGTH=247 /DNA_ID=CAMNT_0007266807 /DNA_START=366 /DNA_END=1109 /DNA_ORIENTATION=+